MGERPEEPHLCQVLGGDEESENCLHPPICFSAPSLRSSTNELAVLISRMQTNADQVEKDILETQSRLKEVSCGGGWWEGERLCLEMQVGGKGNSFA